jgi:hypothetical protein
MKDLFIYLQQVHASRQTTDKGVLRDADDAY